MGTVFSFDVRAPGVDSAALDEAIGWLHWVDATFSTYSPQSEISRLARRECAVTDCAPEVAQVLAECARLHAATDGYFTDTPFGTLDPSGYVKGWAIERVSDMLRAAGSVNHCVNGGGDVKCVGVAAAGRPWHIGIADPLRRGHYAAVVAGTDAADLAVATSGSTERGAHIAGPDGRPAAGAFASITVVGPSLAFADAFATAAYAMGRRAGDWLEALDGYDGYAVLPNGRTWATGRLAAEGSGAPRAA
jgi:thiamine biosynthesis lipoprotein